MSVEVRQVSVVGNGIVPMVLSLGVTALLVVPVADAGDTPVLLALAGVLVVATAWAAWSRVWAAVRVALVVDALLAMVALGGIAIWPGPVVIAVLLLALASRRWHELAPPPGYVRLGRMTAETWWLLIGTIAVSAGALVVWAIIERPSVSPYLQWTAAQPLWLVIVGIAAFAVLNSIGEELLFRGVFVTELAKVASAWTAVLAVSVAFAVAHVAGFPSGWVGALMAGVYGLALGVLRIRSGGMLAPFLAHVGADVTIGLLAVLVLI